MLNNFEALKLLCAVEKYLNIHRDFIYLNTKTRVIIITLFITEIIVAVHLLTIVFLRFLNMSFMTPSTYYTTFSIFVLRFANSVSCMFYYSLKCGKDFRNLLDSLSSCHDLVKHHASYKESRSSLKMRCVFAMITLAILRITLNIQMSLSSPPAPNHTIALLSFLIIETWSEFRYIVELLMYCCVLSEMKYVLQAIRAVKFVEMETVAYYARIYRLLLDCGRHLQKGFSGQTLFLLVVTAVQFVAFSVRIVQDLLALDFMGLLIRPHRLFFVLISGATFMATASAGQGVQNEVANFHRMLSKLRLNSLNKERQQDLRDLQRLVFVQPVSVKLLPTLPVGMYLLPTVLSLTVNHIIVTLQMNNDI